MLWCTAEKLCSEYGHDIVFKMEAVVRDLEVISSYRPKHCNYTQTKLNLQII
jgi:hypothetical protein